MTKRMRKSQITQSGKLQKLIPTEQQECITFFAWAQTIPLLRRFLIHIPNEGRRTPWGGKLLKSMGLKPGLPDYQFPVPNNKYNGLWIEMKRRDPKLHKKNPYQEVWIVDLKQIGHYATYAYGAEHAIQIVEAYVADKL